MVRRERAGADAAARFSGLSAHRLGGVAYGPLWPVGGRHRRGGARTAGAAGRLMAGPVLLATDQGTPTSNALLVAPDGSVLWMCARPMSVYYPRSRRADHSAPPPRAAVVALLPA